MLGLLFGLGWAAGLPRRQGAAIEAAVSAPCGADVSALVLLSAARAISKKAVPGTRALPFTLQHGYIFTRYG